MQRSEIHNSMEIEAAGQLLSAVTDNAVATAKASSSAITRAAQHPTHHRKAA